MTIDKNINNSDSLSPAAKMQAYRQRMRDAGLRPVQLWVPDMRSQSLKDEAKRQSLLVAGTDDDILDFIEQIADW